MKYAVFNPTDGLYTQHDDKQSARQQLLANMIAFYLWQTHNAPVSLVTVVEEIEQWNAIPEAELQELLPTYTVTETI